MGVAVLNVVLDAGRSRSGRSPDWLKFKNPLGGLHLKTRIFALAVALAMPASAASAATYDLTSNGSLFISGPLSNIENISIFFTVDATVIDRFSGQDASWFAIIKASTDLSPFAVPARPRISAGIGRCLAGQCGSLGNRFPGSGGFGLLISDAARSVTWSIGFSEASNVLLTPHITLTLRDDLTPVPVPLPAALPLFAAGLGVMGLCGWRKRKRRT